MYRITERGQNVGIGKAGTILDIGASSGRRYMRRGYVIEVDEALISSMDGAPIDKAVKRPNVKKEAGE